MISNDFNMVGSMQNIADSGYIVERIFNQFAVASNFFIYFILAVIVFGTIVGVVVFGTRFARSGTQAWIQRMRGR